MNELFERIIYDAINKKVTDIHFLLKEQAVIKFRLNGSLQIYEIIDYKQMTKLINYIRFISKIDLNYYRKPQTGHLLFEQDNRKYNLRISSLMGKDTDSLVIRILNNHQSLNINNITYDKHVKHYLKSITKLDNGLFVISGATGSGKSTTLYAILDSINQQFKKNIITLEDPIEINKDYCLQIELNEKQGINYQESLKQILRHDPDVIMIGEIRDENTAKLALTCALTGHLVLTTIHASDCINTLKRLLNLQIPKIDLEDVLVGVVSQKLKINKTKDIVIVSEYMSKDDINSYLNNDRVSYYDFNKAFLFLNKEGILDE